MGKKIKPIIKSLNNKQPKLKTKESIPVIIEQQPATIDKNTKTKLLINLSVLHIGPPPKHFTIESNTTKMTANQKLDDGARAKVDTNLKNPKTKCRNGKKPKPTK